MIVRSSRGQMLCSITATHCLRLGRNCGRLLQIARDMSTDTTRRPVHLVLFDVFDTLCTPRIPVHEQCVSAFLTGTHANVIVSRSIARTRRLTTRYHEEAISAGVSPSSISPESVRSGFKPAFKELNQRYPLWGKHATPPISPGEWWIALIRQCIAHAGASSSELDKAMPRLGPSLLERFESDHGYRLFPDTLPCLKELQKLGIKTSVVSNADPRILKTLDSLRILPLLSYPPTLSWNVEASKPDPKIFQHACRACGEEAGAGVLMVGDEFSADYHGALSANLGGRLIRREGEWSDGAIRSSSEDLGGVHVIRSLDEIVQEVKSRNAR